MWLDDRVSGESLYSYSQFCFLKCVNGILPSCYCQRDGKRKSIIKVYGICFNFNVVLCHFSAYVELSISLWYNYIVILFHIQPYKMLQNIFVICKLKERYLTLKKDHTQIHVIFIYVHLCVSLTIDTHSTHKSPICKCVYMCNSSFKFFLL